MDDLGALIMGFYGAKTHKWFLKFLTVTQMEVLAGIVIFSFRCLHWNKETILKTHNTGVWNLCHYSDEGGGTVNRCERFCASLLTVLACDCSSKTSGNPVSSLNYCKFFNRCCVFSPSLWSRPPRCTPPSNCREAWV